MLATCICAYGAFSVFLSVLCEKERIPVKLRFNPSAFGRFFCSLTPGIPRPPLHSGLPRRLIPTLPPYPYGVHMYLQYQSAEQLGSKTFRRH